jgi:uncharacterized repeat protein (TIGR04052 family)
MHRVFAPLPVLFLFACGAPSATPDAGEHHHEPVTELRFAAKVGTADFACGGTFTVGTPATQYQPRDLRFYVSELTLITEDGASVPFELNNDGVFQNAGVALVDLENATGACTTGTPQTHPTLTGTAPGGHYTAVEFTVGVPFAQNHQDAASAAAPLDSTAMFWNWLGGYKFLRIDGLTTGLPTGHNLHVGSTGCTAGATPNSVASCSAPNRARIALTGFDPEKSVITLDLAALFAGANLDTNLEMTAPGCMSGATDTDCAPFFAHLGLPFGATAAGPQTVFSVQ